MRAVAIVASVVLLGACGASQAGGGGEPTVVASFYPLAFVAERVGGERAVVENLTPPGAEAHDVEPSSSQVVALAEAGLVLYLGGGFQPSIEQLARERGDGAVDVSEGQELLAADEDAGDDHPEEAFDPHLWLDPTRLIAVAETVADRLAGLDPDGANTYRDNADELVAELEELDRSFERGLSGCSSRAIVTSHEAFGYLAERYGLEQIGIAGLAPESEPSPQRIAEVARFVREHDVDTVFFERLVSPEVADTIAAETGAGTAALDPLEGPPARGDYLSAMRANLRSLRTALGCS